MREDLVLESVGGRRRGTDAHRWCELGRACHMFNVQAEPMADHFPIGIYAIPEISMVGAPEY